jgi:hypothetical protein
MWWGTQPKYSFEIVYIVNAACTVVITVAHILAVGGIVAVWFMRKKKAFKAKPKKAT